MAPGKETRRKLVVMPLLEQHGWTPARWTSLAGIDSSVVYDYLKGKGNPRPVLRRAMAEALEIAVDQLPD
jgi:hypothetical protein